MYIYIYIDLRRHSRQIQLQFPRVVHYRKLAHNIRWKAY